MNETRAGSEALHQPYLGKVAQAWNSGEEDLFCETHERPASGSGPYNGVAKLRRACNARHQARPTGH
jgi:hypothetical protein